MKLLINIAIGLICLINVLPIHSQENTIDFSISSNSVFVSGHETIIQSSISKTGQTLSWIQSVNGIDEINNYSIVTVEENWDTQTSTGNITYVMNDDGYQCQFIINSSNSEITATLTFIISETEQEEYIFQVNSINYN